MEIAGVYDIETEDWDRFVCGGLLTSGGSYFEATHRNEKDLVDAILRVQGTVIAHNGGHFDHLWFLDALSRFGYLDKLSAEIAMSGSSIVRCVITGPGVKLILADSWRIFPMPLKKLSNGAKDETGMRCLGVGDCADIIAYQRRYPGEYPDAAGCGGYCAIKRDMAPAALRRVMDYCEQDCRALLDGISHMLGVADELGVEVAYTVGGSAWKTARAKTGVANQPFTSDSEHLYYYARSGYYGGRVGLFNREASGGWQYDITSSYPFQCSQPLPFGAFKFAQSRAAARAAYSQSSPGIYSAYVTVPEMFIPPLPTRARINGERRLAFPTGTFQGAWPLPELQYAESLGCTIEPFAALTFESEEIVFADMMDELISARLKYGKKTREGEWLKLVANSMYGKLASRPEVRGIFINPSARTVMSDYPLERHGTRTGLYIQTRERIPECGHIVWAAYITARGRVQLHKMLTAEGGKDALYCDTDSCFTTKERSSQHGIGNGLGSWAIEGPFTDFHGIAPKVYRYVRNGKPTLKAKGVVLPGDIDKAWELIKSGQPVTGKAGICGLKTALKKDGPLFQKTRVTRLVSEGFGDRFPDGKYGSRPPRAHELEFTNEEEDGNE